MQLIRNLIKVSWASFQHHKSSKTSKSYKEPTHFKNKGDCLGIYFWHSPWCSTNGSVMNRTLCKDQEQFSKNTPGTVNKTLLLSVRLLQSSFEYIQSEEYNGFFFSLHFHTLQSIHTNAVFYLGMSTSTQVLDYQWIIPITD